MQKNDKIKLNSYLAPLSFLYGIGIWLRNRLFDWGILHSEQYSIPVICIGNLSVGGTGKTPHTEYIIRLLKDKYRIAVLSRGYKRKTSGFVLADSESSNHKAMLRGGRSRHQQASRLCRRRSSIRRRRQAGAW